MKKIVLFFCLGTMLFSCNNKEDKSTTPAVTTADKPAADLPYTASYTTSWSSDVSDADLKTVLMTYKYWSDNNIPELTKCMADTVTIDMASGDHITKSNADLMKMWTTNRDSLSSVRIVMDSWHKMYATDKKDAYIVTWYNEYDTYKTGRVDSAAYHDINQIKNGKITWYSTYKRPLK